MFNKNVTLNFDNAGRTRKEAYEAIKPVLKAYDVDIDDIESVAMAYRCMVGITTICGFKMVVTVEWMRSHKSNYSKPAEPGCWVMARTHTYTPFNNRCSAIGEIIMNHTVSTPADAEHFYRTHRNLLDDEINHIEEEDDNYDYSTQKNFD